jgi:hypothetical protein
MSYIIPKIRCGDSYEYECSRTTHRIHATRAILESQGVDFTLHPNGHSEKCERHPSRLGMVAFNYRDWVCCNCEFQNARPELPEWLTDEMILDAWNLANKVIEASAAVHHRAIAEARR